MARAARIRNTPLRSIACALALAWIIPGMTLFYLRRGRFPNYELAFTLYMAAAAGFFLDEDR